MSEVLLFVICYCLGQEELIGHSPFVLLRREDMNTLGKAAGNFGPALKSWPLSFKVLN